MKRAVAIFLTVLCALLCGCSALSLEEEDILAVPDASGDESEIISLIAQNFSSPFELVYPLTGENKNAVTICDTGKGEEAVAVFREKNDPGVIQILFAEKDRDSYTYLGSSSIPTSVIDRVDFADLDGDSKKEVLVGYQGASSPLRSLAIYRTEEEISVTDTAACYTKLVLGDFNSDSAEEVLCLTESRQGEPPLSTLMGYHPQKGLLSISSCALSFDGASIENLIFGEIAENLKGAVIDEKLQSGEYVTEALYYSKEQKLLSNPLFLFSAAQDTKRELRLLSKDIDADGIIEIPTVEEATAPSDDDKDLYCDLVVYKSLDFSAYSLKEKKTAVICPEGDYTFTLPDEKKNALTAKYDESERTMSICLLDFEKGNPVLSGELFYIKTYQKENYSENRVIEAKLCESPSNVYTFLIKETQGAYAFSDTEIEKSFEILGASSK